MMYELVFSPTGGTKKVADLLTEELDSNHKYVDLSERKFDFSNLSFCEKDVCVIAVPSFGGRVPSIAVDHIKLLHGNDAKAILIAVYGNRAYEDTLIELKDVVTKVGFVPIAAVAANAEHSIMHQFGAGRPDALDRKELKAFALKIKTKLKGERMSGVEVPGNRPYREYNGIPMKPKVSKKCDGCGVCVKKCPVGAISKTTPEKTDTDACISCMRCIAICPQNARYISKTLLAASSLKLKKACSERKKNELFL